MKKIIFWIDVGRLIEFATAKFLGEKGNVELFAIYDFDPHLCNSFKNQKIVNFKKTWCLWENINHDDNKPDIEYLEKFEHLYGINLWEIIYGERVFSHTNSFHKFQELEMLSILEKECKLFENILDSVKPDFLIIDVTDFHRNHLFTELCRKKGIKVLMRTHTKIDPGFIISSDYHIVDDEWKQYDYEQERGVVELNNVKKKFDMFELPINTKANLDVNIPLKQKIEYVYKWMTHTFSKEYERMYIHRGATRINVIYFGIRQKIIRYLRGKFIDKIFSKNLPENEKFVYYPLHVQPERSADLDSPFYSNQSTTIQNIARSLPIGYKLYVKEHPIQIRRSWRPISFYQKLNNLPNVRLIHPQVNPKILLEKCSMVITLSGTAALESLIFNKPSIVFGKTIFSKLDSIYQVQSLNCLPELIKNVLNSVVNLNEVQNFLVYLKDNSYDFTEMNNTIKDKLLNSGFAHRDDFSVNDVDLIIEHYRSKFQKLIIKYSDIIHQNK